MSKAKVTIMGSFVVDLMGRAPHLPVMGETVKGSFFKLGPGGKGSNQAVASQRSGADVTMITKLGRDSFSEIALQSFKNEGMDTEFIFRDETYDTGAALIMVDEVSSENKILVILGANEHITDNEIETARLAIENADIFLTQLETNVDAVQKAVGIAYEKGIRVILNPAPVQAISEDILEKVYILTPNEVEASILSGVEVDSVEAAAKAARILMNRGAANVIVTLGSKGALVVTNQLEALVPCPALEYPVVDTTGAGDAFNGGLATALAEGKNIIEAVQFANSVAALSVTKIGTAPAMPYRQETEGLLEKNYI